MKYRLYVTSEQAWHAMLESIIGATRSIYLESFILVDDETTHHFFEVLKEKARSGLKIKIIVDQIASWLEGSFKKDELEKAGIEVLFFKSIFHSTHRKILIVDESTAFLGGVNIKGAYAKWFDLHLRITGHLVKHLVHSFVRLYYLAGGRDPEILALKRLRLKKFRTALYRAKSWLIEHWPIKGKSVLRKYYKKKIAEAKNTIMIVTPYFIPHRWLIKSLRRAAMRGVKIEIIIPEKTDFWLANIAHRLFAEKLDFISFFLIQEMNHAKVLLIDDREGLVGSNNIDAQSFDFNIETSVIFQRKDLVGDIKKIVERWKKIATPFDPSQHALRWYERAIAVFIRFLQPIL